MKVYKKPRKIKLTRKRIRVAAYARVSVASVKAHESLEAQKRYFSNLISARPDWEFVGIYSDEGISGVTDERNGLSKLLEDCRARKIDLVVAKSVTRLARNTVILLNTIRELKALGIGIYFEKENINTMSLEGEFLLTLLASYAQEEARSASENMRWSYRRRFARGESTKRTAFGYWKDEDGELQINEDEAAVVRRIYEEYLEGTSMSKIAQGLNADGIKTLRGRPWSSDTVANVLGYEGYAGYSILQKTICLDYISKKRVKNKGQLPKYIVEGTMPGIVSRQTFDTVQRLRREYRMKMNGAGYGKSNED